MIKYELIWVTLTLSPEKNYLKLILLQISIILVTNVFIQ